MTTRQEKRLKNPIQKYNNLSNDQSEAKRVIENNAITCLLGRAGSGKTHLAVAYALEKLALERKRGGIEKIIITRPTIARKEDNLGYAPGSPDEKMEHWMMPILDIVESIEGIDKTTGLIKNKHIQTVPLMHIMGRSFNSSIVILDEAQNLSKNGMEMVFTRLGRGSKLILCGDDRQSLIDEKETGLSRLVSISEQIDGLDYYSLSSNFRHKIIEDLLSIF